MESDPFAGEKYKGDNMQSNDIAILRFRDPQTPTFWCDVYARITRDLDLETYIQLGVEISGDRRSMRMFLKDMGGETNGVN